LLGSPSVPPILVGNGPCGARGLCLLPDGGCSRVPFRADRRLGRAVPGWRGGASLCHHIDGNFLRDAGPLDATIRAIVHPRYDVEVYEGTVSFVRDARTRGVRTAIVSSSQNCAAVLDAAGLTQLFDIRVDGIDLRRLGFAGKPAPDMFLEAARRLKVPPDRAIVFEDAVVGVEAGRAGRFRLVVGIGQGDHAASLRAHGADIVVADLRELSLEQQWARP
jgi:HAD superfamily hydrolase (TIGR01509 family)